MRKIGFSTGALAHSDFRQGIEVLRRKGIVVIEISALRQQELEPLVLSLDGLDLSGFDYVSIHAPSRIKDCSEPRILALLQDVVKRKFPIIVHPDVIKDSDAWRSLGSLLVVENMDKRKPCGRTAEELDRVFDQLPEATFCLDLGHAHQVDKTMSEASLILRRFGERLRQLHLSEVSTAHKHNPLSMESVFAFRRVSNEIADDVPVVLESRVNLEEVEDEIAFARRALPSQNATVAASD